MLLLYILLFAVTSKVAEPTTVNDGTTIIIEDIVPSTEHLVSTTDDDIANLENATQTTVNADYDVLRVEELPNEFFNTSIGSTHEVTISQLDFMDDEKCNLISSDGISHEFSQLSNIGPFEVIFLPTVACGLRINITTDDVIGNWTLEYTATSYDTRIKKILPFTIYVEETVQAAVDTVVIAEGRDFYFRLNNSISEFKSCRPIGPNGKDYIIHEDTRFPEECGYIYKNATVEDSGTWEIVYGDRIIYKALIQLNVFRYNNLDMLNLTWIKDRPIEVDVGPDNAVYCTILSAYSVVVQDGFGRCHISLERVTSLHNGYWKMLVALPGQVIPDEIYFKVQVIDAEPKPEVSTNVVAVEPHVTVSCKVLSPYPLRACKFRKPSGAVLMATEGVGESNYTFYGQGSSYQSGLHSHDCGIQITNPQVGDLGLWRCALETESEEYYGFLNVKFPWGMRDPEVVAAIITEPVLTADRSRINNIVGDAETLTCSIQSSIRYCYFRAPNGSVFNVGPDLSHDMATYAGAGFDAGDCGIRFPSLALNDSGIWSCHVGIPDITQPEQRATIVVSAMDLMYADQRMINGQIQIEAHVLDNRPLEYCRYVRIDGFGFTGEAGSPMPSDYFNIQSLSSGICGIVVNRPTRLDYLPWTIVAKVIGQREEISRVTTNSLEPIVPPQTVVRRVPFFWILMLALSSSILLMACIAPKNNRKWTYERANAIRSSFKHTFSRKPVNQVDNTNGITAPGA